MTKEEKREYDRQWYLKNRKKKLEQRKQYYQDNKEEIAEYQKQYYQDNKETILEQQKQYHQTPMGRASCLINAHKTNDKKYNRGECTLTAEWIIENIFSQPCHYCGETDWRKMGCDRIDNSLPHTPGNVVPCCEECNKKRGTKSYEEFLKEITQVKQNTNANS